MIKGKKVKVFDEVCEVYCCNRRCRWHWINVHPMGAYCNAFVPSLETLVRQYKGLGTFIKRRLGEWG